MPVCPVCGEDAAKLLRCSVCTHAQYCSRACQQKAWPEHKGVCKLIAARKRRRTMYESAAAATPLPRVDAAALQHGYAHPLHLATRDANKPASNVLLILPDSGAMEPFVAYAEAVQLPQTVVAVCTPPHALPFGLDGRTWWPKFDVHTGDPLPPSAARGKAIMASTEALVALVEHAVAAAGAQARYVFLLGAGDGAAMAGMVARVMPLRLGGVIGMRGALPAEFRHTRDFVRATHVATPALFLGVPDDEATGVFSRRSVHVDEWWEPKYGVLSPDGARLAMEFWSKRLLLRETWMDDEDCAEVHGSEQEHARNPFLAGEAVQE